MELRPTSPVVGMQQAGAPETAVNSVLPCFYLQWVITNG